MTSSWHSNRMTKRKKIEIEITLRLLPNGKVILVPQLLYTLGNNKNYDSSMRARLVLGYRYQEQGWNI